MGSTRWLVVVFGSLCATATGFAPVRNDRVRRSQALSGWLENLFPAPVDLDQSDVDARALEFPEQYPATYDLNTASVWGDWGDTAKVRPLLKNTQLENRALQVAYDANWQGWNPKAFHKAVDGKGAAVVLAQGRDGKWVGAYNPKGWAGTGGARPSVAAFLFYEKRGGFQKLRKVGGGGLACAKDDPGTGIWIGADGLIIPLGNKMAQSKLGTYFERGPEGRYSLFPEGYTQLKSLKVIVGVYEKGEGIPYSGAVLDFTSG